MKYSVGVSCALCALLGAGFSWAAEVALVNPGFEEATDRPTGWRISQHAGAVSFHMGLDEEVFAEGKRSFRIKRLIPQVYGLVDQVVTAPDSGGRSLLFSAMLRTEEVGPMGWVLVVNFLGETGGILGQVRSEPMTGTADWRRVTLKESIPAGTQKLAAGAMLLDSGTGWVDDLKLSVGSDEGFAAGPTSP